MAINIHCPIVFLIQFLSPSPISSTSSASSVRDVSGIPQVVTKPFPTPPLPNKRNLPLFPGNPEARFSVSLPPVLPKICSRSSITSQDSFTSQSTILPTSFSEKRSRVSQLEVTQSRVNVPNHKKASQAGSSANYPVTETTSNFPSTGASDTFLTYSRPTSTGAIPKTRLNILNQKKASQAGSSANYPVKEATSKFASTGASATFLTSSRPTSTGAIPKTYQPGVKTGEQYDSLVAQLQKNHPRLSQEPSRTYVREVRKSNNGKLSGMKRQDFLNKVTSFIQRDRGIVDGACFVQKDTRIVDGARFIQRDKAVGDGADDEDNNCCICLENMLDFNSLYLNPCRYRL